MLQLKRKHYYLELNMPTICAGQYTGIGRLLVLYANGWNLSDSTTKPQSSWEHPLGTAVQDVGN